MEVALMNGAAVVGQGILMNAIGDVYKIIKKNSGNTEFSKIMNDLDIRFDMQIIEALLKDIDEHKKNNSHAVEICINDIHTCINDIKSEIESWQLKMIDQHYSKFYLYGWSSTQEYDTNVSKIKELKSRLNKRVDMVIKLLSMNLI